MNTHTYHFFTLTDDLGYPSDCPFFDEQLMGLNLFNDRERAEESQAFDDGVGFWHSHRPYEKYQIRPVTITIQIGGA